MKTMHERIRQARLAKKMTQAELAEKLSVTPQSVQQWETSTEPKKKRLMKIADVLDIDVNWLLFGERKNKDGRLENKMNFREISEWDESTPLEDDEVEIPFYKSIELAAGSGCNENKDYNGFKLRYSRSTLRKYGISSKNVYAFTVHGNSMEPVIPNGATVFVNCCDNSIVDGGIYFIEQEDLFRIKILLRQPGKKVIIRSFNSIEYPDEIADLDTVKVIGRVFNASIMFM
ncbi:XRE family transcriptional regulator [Arsenophonus apicola]|uniref:XRE family transcriptional regulator n=1 Tax=Arsenophonus apicola TaxID=2879119 RepID=UPI00387931F3